MPTTVARVAQALGLVRSEAPTQPPPGAGVMPPARSESVAITPRSAATLDSVFRAFQVLQTAAEQLTFDVWRSGRRVPNPPPVTSAPDVDSDLPTFLGESVMSLATRGNLYWRVLRDTEGQALNCRVLDPLTVSPFLNRAGRKMLAWNGQDWTPRDIVHMRFMTFPGELEGLGPVQAAARTLAGSLSRSSYADEWFDTGNVPSGVLKSDQTLTAAQAEQYKERWQASQSYRNGPAVLGQGLDYRPLLLKPSEVQWLEAQNFGVNGVARLFGIPASYMLATVEGASRTYANQEQEDIAFVRFTLMAYLRKIETAMTTVLPRGQTTRLNVDALLRTDTKTRYEAHKVGIEAQFLTVPEVRAIEGLDPLPTAQLPTDADQAPATQESTP